MSSFIWETSHEEVETRVGCLLQEPMDETDTNMVDGSLEDSTNEPLMEVVDGGEGDLMQGAQEQLQCSKLFPW